MTARAPYCPDTLSVIKTSADNRIPARMLAAQLGWEVDELLRIAKRHGYDIAAPEPVQRAVMPVRRIEPSDARIEFRTSMSLQDVIDALPDRLAALMRILADMGEHSIRGETIADMLDVSFAAVKQLIFDLRNKLQPTSFRVETKLGPAGGYSLVQNGRPD